MWLIHSLRATILRVKLKSKGQPQTSGLNLLGKIESTELDVICFFWVHVPTHTREVNIFQKQKKTFTKGGVYLRHILALRSVGNYVQIKGYCEATVVYVYKPNSTCTY